MLGALFDILSKAIALKPSIKLSRRPRLADWGEYAASVYEVMGWSAETFLKDWDEVVKVQNQATLDGSPVAQAIIKLMEEHEECSHTSSKMHAVLKEIAEAQGVDVARDKAWPKSARWLWRRIKDVLALLAAAGIEAGRVEDRSGSKITLRKMPKNVATNTTGDENPTGKAKAGGNTHGDDATSNATEPSNATPNATPNPADRAESGNSGNSGSTSGDFSEGASTPEQADRIRRLVREGMSVTWARRTVLADGHPLDFGCGVCL